MKNEEAFGISYFLTGFPEKYSARSLSVSRVLFIDREDMLEILKDFTDDLVFIYLKLHFINFFLTKGNFHGFKRQTLLL